MLDQITRGTGSGSIPSNGMQMPRGRRGVQQQRVEDGANFNSIECRETIRQNLTTLDSLIDCGCPFNNEINNINQSSRVELFDFNRRKFIKGQWVDVKDTIDQWLEAQVIDVRDDRVYIHYNGWGNRWDEWIEVNSPRIRPFRYHTRQSDSIHQSPFPNLRPDADVNLQSNLRDMEFFDLFDDIKKAFNTTTDLMRSINDDRRIANSTTDTSTKQKLQRAIYYKSKNLVPFIDRVGRVMSDIGTYMNFTLKNNKLEE
jgi:hypothetical protein